MTLALYLVCGVLACIAVAATLAATADAYPRLPDRIPLHIGPGGVIDGRGPRAFIWMLPVVQAVTLLIFVSAGFAAAAGVPGTHGSPRDLAVPGACVLTILWRAQALLLKAAREKSDRVDMRGFWTVFFVAFPLTLVAAFALR